MTGRQSIENEAVFGVGSYTARDAGRLIGTTPRNISRWMKGYTYRRNDVRHRVDPLWMPQWPVDDHQLAIGFRDLIELRFVKAFLDSGLGLLTIRHCLDRARECVQDDYPFSTRRFRTDGRTIFLESMDRLSDGSSELIDLKKNQFAFKQIIERTFRDLDIDDDAVVRWRPYRGKPSIVIDPQRAFGQPIAADFGVPTVALAGATEAEGSPDRVARLYDVPLSIVRDAVRFESTLKAA